MEISAYSIYIWISAILIASLDLVILFGSKNLSSRIFVLFTFFSALWAGSYGLHMTISDPNLALFFIKAECFLGLIISVTFYYFSKVYPDDIPPRYPAKIKILIIALLGLIYLVFFHSDVLIYSTTLVDDPQRWGWYHSHLMWLYVVAFIFPWVAGLNNIYKRLLLSTSIKERANLTYMLIALSIGVTPPFVFDIVFPVSNFFYFGWIGPITGLVWIYVIALSIVKHRQMNVKVVVAEVLATGMTVIFFINIFTDFSLGLIGRVITFFVFILLAVSLIKIALQEAKQKEMLQDLNQNLNKIVDAQTAELKKAYEIEKLARVELQNLNQNKSDFIIITQHHLRTPLSQIRWYADSVKKGLYGSISSELNDVIERISRSSESLSKTLNDFLSVAQLKIGVKVLDLQPTNIKSVIDVALHQYYDEIRTRKIVVSFKDDGNIWPFVLCDTNRMKDVFSIVIDNAVKYNTTGGNISIVSYQKNEMLVVCISNTGIGIKVADKLSMLKQSFFRSSAAKTINPYGMGVGLLVARTIIKAHGGSISIDSDGEEKGISVLISLPLQSNNAKRK